jgi:hypothetical protein
MPSSVQVDVGRREMVNGNLLAVEADLIKVEQTDDFTEPKASWL